MAPTPSTPDSLRAGAPTLHLTPSLGPTWLSSTSFPQRLLGLNYFHHCLSNNPLVTEHTICEKTDYTLTSRVSDLSSKRRRHPSGPWLERTKTLFEDTVCCFFVLELPEVTPFRISSSRIIWSLTIVAILVLLIFFY